MKTKALKRLFNLTIAFCIVSLTFSLLYRALIDLCVYHLGMGNHPQVDNISSIIEITVYPVGIFNISYTILLLVLGVIFINKHHQSRLPQIAGIIFLTSIFLNVCRMVFASFAIDSFMNNDYILFPSIQLLFSIAFLLFAIFYKSRVMCVTGLTYLILHMLHLLFINIYDGFLWHSYIMYTSVDLILLSLAFVSELACLFCWKNQEMSKV